MHRRNAGATCRAARHSGRKGLAVRASDPWASRTTPCPPLLQTKSAATDRERFTGLTAKVQLRGNVNQCGAVGAPSIGPTSAPQHAQDLHLYVREADAVAREDS